MDDGRDASETDGDGRQWYRRPPWLAVLVLAVLLGAWMVVTSIGSDEDPSSLAVLERAPEPDDRLSTFSYGPGTFDVPWKQLPAPHVGDLAAEYVAADASRRVAANGDDLVVYVAPVFDGAAALPEREEPLGLLVSVDRPGGGLTSTIPIPRRGDAVWAGTVFVSGTPFGVVIAGNGLDTVVTGDGFVAVEDNGVLVEGLEDGATVELHGPAGTTKVTARAAG